MFVSRISTTTAKLLRFPDQKIVTFFLMYFINQCKLSVKTYGQKAKRTRLEKGMKIGVFVFCGAITELIFTPHQRGKKETLL